MNHARFLAIHAGLTSAAKKVYEAVPISEPWTTAQIVTELNRLGSNMEFRIAAGCIRALVEAGLVVEQTKDQYYRVPVRPKPQTTTLPPEPVMATAIKKAQAEVPLKTTPPPPPPISPIDKLTGLAARVENIVADLKVLAGDIETAALEIEEQRQAEDADTEKLRRLRSVLKELA